MHGAKRPAERLGRAVAEPRRDVEQLVSAKHIRGSDRHAAPSDVVTQWHARQ